ncbi:hypothetical protein FOL47_000981 [Perkinsus chesapeaki]|uniref:FCP1 homology domain-containing protein n=1 Tax=Perkinsus chesapeaki TaxID=330153 RepID=A0A7J6MM48_PERCH|nr:hypothetical protein FOL47_000981 [Perkinsus chesapeaki]
MSSSRPGQQQQQHYTDINVTMRRGSSSYRAAARSTKALQPPDDSQQLIDPITVEKRGTASTIEDTPSARLDPVPGDTGGPASTAAAASTIPQKPPVKAEKLLNVLLQQLSCAEHVAFNLLDGVRCDANHVSFFCREYFNTAAIDSGMTMSKYSTVAAVEPKLKKQIKTAMVIEMSAVALCSVICGLSSQSSEWAQVVPLVVKARLRALLQHVHENVLLLIDYVCQKAVEFPGDFESNPYSIANFDLNILYLAKRYRAMGKVGHVNALTQNNEEAEGLIGQLCKSLSATTTSRIRGSTLGDQISGLVTEVLGNAHKTSLGVIRGRYLQGLRFRPVEGQVYERYEKVASDQSAASPLPPPPITVCFEPLPPMLPHLIRMKPLLPAHHSGASGYTAVIDLDETLVHYSEVEGVGGRFEMRPGCVEFLARLAFIGCEVVIFTAATQDYADWVVDQLESLRGVRIHHRLYRQHALPWGPIFVKDLTRLGRRLDRTIIVDNVKENFMLQPDNGIFIFPWYSERDDTALFDLLPVFEELVATRVSVPVILNKYKDEIPSWAGFDGIDVEECGVANQLALAAATIPEDGGVLAAGNKITGAFQAPPPPPAAHHDHPKAAVPESQRFPGTPMRVYEKSAANNGGTGARVQAVGMESAATSHRVVVMNIGEQSAKLDYNTVESTPVARPYSGRIIYSGAAQMTPSVMSTGHAPHSAAVYGSTSVPQTPMVAHRQVFQVGLPPLQQSLFSPYYQPYQYQQPSQLSTAGVTASQPFTVRVQAATRAIGAMPASPVMGTRMIMSATNRAANAAAPPPPQHHFAHYAPSPRQVASWPSPSQVIPPSPLVSSRIITTHQPNVMTSPSFWHQSEQQTAAVIRL